MSLRAVQIDRFGGPEVLEIRRAERPVLRDGDVLVRSVGSSINPIDSKLRTIDRNLGFPLTLGWDLAGVAVESRDPTFRRGDQVIGMSLVLKTRIGTWADLVAMPAADLAPAPVSIALTESASLPLAGLTALQAWQRLDVPTGGRLLVVGAAGAIGAFAVQLAVDDGITVDGIVSRREHIAEPRTFGAESVTTDQAELPSGAYDAIIDTVGLPRSDVDVERLLIASGTYITSASHADLPDRTSAGRVLVQRDPDGLRTIARLVDSGVLRPRIAARYPLSEIRAAHQHAERGGLLGKVVITF
jgi:NADPH:quinone reductase-like Zn-dependent oxidoreductase